MATLVEDPKLGHMAVQASSPIAHPSSGAAQDHTRTWKLLRATLGYNTALLFYAKVALTSPNHPQHLVSPCSGAAREMIREMNHVLLPSMERAFLPPC